MKKFLIPAVVVGAAALGGCAAYDNGVYTAGTPYYTAGTTYYSTAPVYSTYVAPPVVVQRLNPTPNDRDGDGVPNWRDRDPNDWRYR